MIAKLELQICFRNGVSFSMRFEATQIETKCDNFYFDGKYMDLREKRLSSQFARIAFSNSHIVGNLFIKYYSHFCLRKLVVI